MATSGEPRARRRWSSFREVTLAATEVAETFTTELTAELAQPADLEASLISLARRLADRASDVSVVRLRRLLIGEAHRFPDLAAEYYRLAPGKVVSSLAEAIAELAARGLLRAPDPKRAAEHFAFLVLGSTLDRALFGEADGRAGAEARTSAADDGVRAFLAAYRAGEAPSVSRLRP